MTVNLTKKALIVAALAGLALGQSASAIASGGVELKEHDWTFTGPMGTYDRAAQQRGFQVYKEVCSACHGLKYIAFRNLTEIGLTEDEVKAIAAEYSVAGDPDEYGDPTERPGRPEDYLPSPFPNDNAARFSNNGALPPDLSLIVKARAGGPDYLYSLLLGYIDPPECKVVPVEQDDGTVKDEEVCYEVPEGLTYNLYFPGSHKYFVGGDIAMAMPLFEDAVEYADGTPATVVQLAEDVTVFLNWAAEPELEARHKLGLRVMLFMLALTVLVYFSNKRVWADIKKKKDDA